MKSLFLFSLHLRGRDVQYNLQAGSLCGLRKSSECNKTMERETSAIQPWQISFSFIYLHSPNKAWPKNPETQAVDIHDLQKMSLFCFW